MTGKLKLLTLIGPLVLAGVMTTPTSAGWVFRSRTVYRPAYAGYFGGYSNYGGQCCGYGHASYYAGSSFGYGGCNSGCCNTGCTSYYGGCNTGCNSCYSGSQCGSCGNLSYYGGCNSCCPSYGCCNICGGNCGIGCSNCVGGDCQLGATSGKPTPQPNPQPKAEYNEREDARGADSQPMNPPLGDDDPIPGARSGVAPDAPIPDGEKKTFKADKPMNPPGENVPVQPADKDKDGASPNGASTKSPDGAGFQDGTRLKAPVKVNVDDKVAWKSTTTLSRSTVRPSYTTARLVRAAAYPNYAWIPAADETHVAKK